jgi:hypothetical protein
MSDALTLASPLPHNGKAIGNHPDGKSGILPARRPSVKPIFMACGEGLSL